MASQIVQMQNIVLFWRLLSLEKELIVQIWHVFRPPHMKLKIQTKLEFVKDEHQMTMSLAVNILKAVVDLRKAS